MKNLDILRGLFLEQYVQVHTTGGDTGPNGDFASKVIIGVVHDILEDFIVISELEGDIKNPIVIMYPQIVSIEALPEQLVSDLKFDMAEQALLINRLKEEENGSLN
jgi:hypothetical protein